MKWLWIFVLVIGSAQGARILALLPFLGQSHFVMFDPLLEELNKRGHSLVVVTPFPRDPPLPKGYKEISLKGIVPYLNNKMEIENSLVSFFTGDLEGLYWLLTIGYEDIFEVEAIKDLINNGQGKFDLALIELFNTDMFLGVAHKLDIPVVALSSGKIMPWAFRRFGSPDSAAYVDGIFFPGDGISSFKGRLGNTIASWMCKMAYTLYFDTYSQMIAEKYLGPIPPLSEIAKNTSLLLINTHFSLYKPTPYPPAIVEVGGLHIKSPKKLPLELENILNNSKNGVIYFSMGSVLKGDTWPPEKREIFLKVFSKLKQNVLWKWEGEMPNKPKNVFLNPWIPQRDILAHPNVVLFITHGGLFGVTESVYSGVPILAIPVFGDQPQNAESARRAGSAIVLDYSTIDEFKLSHAINELLNNLTYKEKASKLSVLFEDRPLSAMDTAIYWIEYVIRHKGASHLKMEAVDLAWYEYYLLDVISTIILITSVIVYIFYFIMTKFLSLICKTSKIKLKSQ